MSKFRHLSTGFLNERLKSLWGEHHSRFHEPITKLRDKNFPLAIWIILTRPDMPLHGQSSWSLFSMHPVKKIMRMWKIFRENRIANKFKTVHVRHLVIRNHQINFLLIHLCKTFAPWAVPVQWYPWDANKIVKISRWSGSSSTARIRIGHEWLIDDGVAGAEHTDSYSSKPSCGWMFMLSFIPRPLYGHVNSGYHE